MRVRHGLHRIEGRLQLLETKTLRSRRTIPLPSLVVRELRRTVSVRKRSGWRWRRVGRDSGFVFTSTIGTPLDPDNCTKIVKAAVKAAGLRDVRMHDFRHGVVSA